MAAEKAAGKPIKDELLATIKKQVNATSFPYLEIIENCIGPFNPELVKTLQLEIPFEYGAHVARKLCNLVTGCNIIRFIPTGDNFRGILTGFNIYGKVMNAYYQSGSIHIFFEWKGVYHE
jgi:hypothetical protein